MYVIDKCNNVLIHSLIWRKRVVTWRWHSTHTPCQVGVLLRWFTCAYIC